MNSDEQRSAELLRSALRHTTGDENADQFMRMTLLASLDSQPELVAVYEEETAPFQAELDLHLTGDTVTGHSTEAKPLGNFMRYAAQAVNEISKSISAISRLGDRLIVEPGPGSVRLQMRVPLPRKPDAQEAIPDGTPTVESQAMDVLTALFEQAEDQNAVDSPLTAAVQRLTPNARNQVRLFAGTAVEQGWTLEGQLRRRGSKPRPVTLTPRGAARLVDEARREDEDHGEAVIFGTIDGHIRSQSIVSFIPEGARPFRAAVMDAELMNDVARLAAEAGIRVRAVFDVFAHIPAGQSEVVRRSLTLRSIAPLKSDEPFESMDDT